MQITQLLMRLQGGDRDAMHAVIPLIYEELKKLARWHLRREVRLAPFETTVLVHEAFLKLAGGRHPAYENRTHFYGIVSRLMRQVLVDKPEPGRPKSVGPNKNWFLPTCRIGHHSRIEFSWRWTTRCRHSKGRIQRRDNS